VDCLASGYLRITLRSRLKGRIAVYSTVVLRLECDGEAATWRLAAARAGRVNMPAVMHAFVTERVFQPFRDSAWVLSDLQYLARNVSRLEVTDGNLALTLKATGRDKEALKYMLQRAAPRE
jgi:hypothetical protein